MTGPLVSVIVPCFNAGPFVAKTLESVLAQTWRSVEILVIDDGSTDDSVAVVTRFVPRGIIHITQPNSGASAARNRGFRESRGEFVQFLDADDLISPNKIEVQVQRLIGQAQCIASAPWGRFCTTPDETKFEPETVWRDLDSRDWFAQSRRDGFGMQFPAIWLLPRGIVEAAGPWNEELSLADDTEYFTRAILAARRVLFCESARCYYRSNVPGSLSGQKSARAWRSFFRVNELNERTVLSVEDSPRMRRVLSIGWQRFAHAAYVHQPNLAEEALILAARLSDVEVSPEGGPEFKLIAAVLGWRTALKMQAAWKEVRAGRSTRTAQIA